MKIIESDGVFSIGNVTGLHNELPLGNYLVRFDPREGYQLLPKPDFILPSKIYGDHSVIDRWLISYKHNSEKNMGILLTGIKGSGKTITAQKFCIESKMPVIIINELFHGSDFIDFISSFSNVIIFIDEFEKVYNRSEFAQEMLSLMDGNFQTKIIFLLTVNDDSSMNYYLNNRLGRVKYKKDYDNLELDVVEAVIEDLLINKDHRDSVYKFFKKVGLYTFDLLVNIIKEMNLFKEDALVAGSYLNLSSEEVKYDIWEHIEGKSVKQNSVSLRGDQDEFSFERNYLSKEDEDRLEELHKKDPQYSDNDFYYPNIKFSDCKITDLDGNIVFENPNALVSLKITLKPQKNYRFIL